MPQLSVLEVKSNEDLMKFIKFPMDLYRNNSYFVPSLIEDEKSLWDPKQNPALKYSEAKQYLAYKKGKVVGRIALMINHKEANELGIHKLRFGWLDFIDDLEVSKALIDTAIQYATNKGLPLIEGPMGITNLDKAGLLTFGFDRLATMIGLYNYEYYAAHLETHGLVKEKEWVEYELQFPEVLPEKVLRFYDLIMAKYDLKVLEFKTKSELIPLVEPMFELLDETYKSLSTYTPISQEQIKMYKEKYFNFINKDYVVCVCDSTGKLIAFAITMPSYSKALQKSKGKLWPFGWIHFLSAGRKNERANFYLIGIHPEYQRRGITSIIFTEIFKSFKKKGIKYLETNPELEDNKSIQVLWQDYQPVNHKRRRTYSLKLK